MGEHLEQFYESDAVDKVRLQLLNATVRVLELVIGPVREGLLLHLDPLLAAAAHGSGCTEFSPSLAVLFSKILCGERLLNDFVGWNVGRVGVKATTKGGRFSFLRQGLGVRTN